MSGDVVVVTPGVCRVQSEVDRLFVLLVARGIELRVDGGFIRWRAPSGAMTVSLIRQIKAHEAELMAVLGQSPVEIDEIARPEMQSTGLTINAWESLV